MIKIQITRDKEQIHSIELTGHAGYADAGEDIVCAAVSSQVISVENSLVRLLDMDVRTVVNEVDGGYLFMELPTHVSKQQLHDGQLLMKHLIFALEVLAENYPEFISITIHQI